MASEKTTKSIEDAVNEVLAFDTDSLRSRPAWGELNFELAEGALTRIFTIAANLKTLPLHFLPEDTAVSIDNNLRSTLAPFENISSFDIKQADPVGQVTAHTNAINAVADKVYKAVTPWIPFLAYQEGDVAKNIASLTNALTEGTALIAAAKKTIEEDKTEMSNIIQQARDASAAAGAAVFTKEFSEESDAQLLLAKSWLLYTVILAGCSLLASVASVAVNYKWPPTSWLELGPKFFVLAIFLSGTLWCGRIYKAFMHQAAVNKHRSLALQTFQAFTDATDDLTVKNAVLLEATHSIFGSSASGFLGESGGPDSAAKIVEIMRSVGPE